MATNLATSDVATIAGTQCTRGVASSSTLPFVPENVGPACESAARDSQGARRRQPLGEPLWTADPTWQKHKQALVTFPSGFTVLELCAGAGTASLALKLLLGSDCLAGAWDTDGNLERIYEFVHGHHAQVHLGPKRGDILSTPLDAFPCANAVVCGPPCQPYSSYGQRGALGDPRSLPFQRCIDIVAELDSRRQRQDSQDSHVPLMFVIFENTMGITQRPGGTQEPPLNQFLGILRRQLGSDWSFSHVHVNSADFGLPQSRNRVYVLGRRLEFYPGAAFPGHPVRFQQRLSAGQLLDLTDVRNAAEYTPLQEDGLRAWKGKFRAAMQDKRWKGHFAFVEVGRDPTSRTLWTGASVKVGMCECLRASGPQLHVFSLGEGTWDSQLSVDRGLRIHERAALQGFPPSIGQLQFTETAGRRIFGNAMSVPVIGCILAQELEVIEDCVGRATLARCMYPSASAIAESQRYVPRTPPATHRFGWDSLRSVFRSSRMLPPRPRSPSPTGAAGARRLRSPSPAGPAEAAAVAATAILARELIWGEVTQFSRPGQEVTREPRQLIVLPSVNARRWTPKWPGYQTPQSHRVKHPRKGLGGLGPPARRVEHPRKGLGPPALVDRNISA